MTIAELFVNIGVKGADQTAKSVATVETGLKDVASTGLAAKAAVIGLIYGLEKLTGMAGARGMELQQFAGATGLSAEKLQKWQYAARQFGVQNEEVAGSVKSVQTAMTDMLLGKGAPAGFGYVSSKVGLDPTRLRDTFYVMDKLQKFAKEVPPDVAANVLKSFGISDTMFQFFAKNKQDIDKVKPSNIFSEREVAALARVDVAWSNFWNRFKMIIGGLTAQNGIKGINVLSGAMSGAQKFFSDLGKATQGIENFKTIAVTAGALIAAAWAPITAAIAGIIYLLDQYNKKKNGEKDTFFDDDTGFLGKKGPIMKFIMGDVPDDVMNPKEIGPMAIPPQKTTSDTMKEVHNTVNQILNIHGVDDAKDVSNESKKGLNDAVRQMSVQGAVK